MDDSNVGRDRKKKQSDRDPSLENSKEYCDARVKKVKWLPFRDEVTEVKQFDAHKNESTLITEEKKEEDFDYELMTKKFDEEVKAYKKKAERILDRLLTIRETINELRLELFLLYKPVEVGRHRFHQQTICRDGIESHSCCIYSKCSQKIKELESRLSQLP